MPIKKVIKKTPVTTAEKIIEKEVSFSPERRVTVSVGSSTEYGQVKLGFSLSENVKDGVDVMEHSDKLFDLLSDKLVGKFEELLEKVNSVSESEVEDELEEDEEDELEDELEEDEEGDEEEEDLTEDDIMKMKKPELVELIEEEEIDIDIKGMKLAEIREAVVDALFAEDEEDADDDADDDADSEDWEDDDWDEEDDK